MTVMPVRAVPAEPPTDMDRALVTEYLGRQPMAAFTVVARRQPGGEPAVICNPPFLDDGTPMPTRFWLCDPELRRRVGTLESTGAVDQVEAELGVEVLAEVHRRAAAEREAAIRPGHVGYRPSGGVGGTRTGVKCLHAHYAWYLAGGEDPVGAWVDDRLAEAGSGAPAVPSQP